MSKNERNEISLVILEAESAPTVSKRTYNRTVVTPDAQYDFAISSRMPQADNPFMNRSRIPMQEVRDFYQVQKDRTQLGISKLYTMLGKDVRAGATLSTLQSSLMNGSRQPTMPGFIAVGMWDTYKKVPGWSEPVSADEVIDLLSHINPHQFFMDARLAHQQVMDTKARTQISRAEILDAMSDVGLADNMLTKILHGGDQKSVTRLQVAYVMAFLNGNNALPVFPERPAKLIIPSLK